MGNILGAVAGFRLIFGISSYILVLIIGATAFLVHPSISEILKGALIPKIPSNTEAGILVLGLIGTTIVPYNLFLGSGISSNKQTVKEMRFGISIAIILGGLFSMAVLIVGTSVADAFSFDKLTLH